LGVEFVGVEDAGGLLSGDASRGFEKIKKV
jgi:hypothetical protein